MGNHELMRPQCYGSHCCGCACSSHQPPPPPTYHHHDHFSSIPPNNQHYNDIPNNEVQEQQPQKQQQCSSCGSCLKHGPAPTSRLYSKNRSSQRYIKQDPWEPVHERSKSLRWTKEQLQKFDNLIEPAKHQNQQNELSSSSSGDNLTDDSGIHSKSTSKDSPRLVTKSIIKYD